MSASAPTSSKIKLFRAKKKMLKSFILKDPYLDSSLGNYKRGSLFRNDVVLYRSLMAVFGKGILCLR